MLACHVGEGIWLLSKEQKPSKDDGQDDDEAELKHLRTLITLVVIGRFSTGAWSGHERAMFAALFIENVTSKSTCCPSYLTKATKKMEKSSEAGKWVSRRFKRHDRGE